MDPLPGVILEIGPHRTLVGPLLQTVRALELQVRDLPRVIVECGMHVVRFRAASCFRCC
jgi:hypothetical protein